MDRIYLLIICGLVLSCNQEKTSSSIISNNITLEFNNLIFEDSLSVFDFHYLYNGGGVGIIDVNNDGLMDIFLGGNMVSSKLFLNRGNMQFEDITEESNLTTDVWINGISVVDLNCDGKSDLYLSVGGADCITSTCNNLLFLNRSENDVIYFEEKSAEVGLKIEGYSQQGLFADFDNDGDLDLFQLQNYVDHNTKNYPKPKQYYSPRSRDKLLINLQQEEGKLVFVDASDKWNVNIPGFGLGVALTDVNQDGYLDVYVANDFITDDVFYINQQGQYFEDQSKQYLKHTSYNSMGVDIADLNGDEMEDIVVVDMLPFQNARQKTMLGEMNFDKYALSRKENYNAQFIRNVVQIHNGPTSFGRTNAFSEIGAFLNLEDTDWSWAPILFDYDNDSQCDLFITNGYGKNITDLDFVNYNSTSTGFGSKEKAVERIKNDIRKLPQVNLPNFLFKNFYSKETQKIVSTQPGISNGAAISDLDNDGDLDIVLNNLNENARIIVNPSTNNFLSLEIEGDSLNTSAIGAKVKVHLDNGKSLVQRITPVRSYMSSMDPRLIFGLGAQKVNSIEVVWPNNLKSSVKIDSDTISSMKLSFSKMQKQEIPIEKKVIGFFEEPTLAVQKEQSSFWGQDFDIQPLLLKPCLNDRALLLQNMNFVFVANIEDAIYKVEYVEDVLVKERMFDLQGYVVTDMKTYRKENGQETLHCVLSTQNQKGLVHSKFLILDFDQHNAISKEWNLAPGIYHFDFIELHEINSMALVLAHFPTAQKYPSSEMSSLFFYDFDGNALNIDAPKMENLNITQVVVEDINADSLQDVILVGEWMSPMILFQSDSGFDQIMEQELSKHSGLWQNVLVEDFDQDGDKDFLMLNLGTNLRYTTTPVNPLKIVSNDLDNNGSVDPIICVFQDEENEYFTYHSKDDLSKILPSIKKNFIDYASFGKATSDNVLETFGTLPKYKYLTTTETMMFEQVSNLFFKKVELPQEVQYSILNDAALIDLDDDNDLDIVFLANNDQIEIHNGKIDALNVLCLSNEGNLQYRPIPADETGLSIPEPSFDMISLKNGRYMLSSDLGIYEIKRSRK